jgi:hypothetical protein
MLTRYKCRAECFADICTFYKWILDYNYTAKNIVKICNIFCKDSADSAIFEFDSNIDDFMEIRAMCYSPK